MSITEKLQSILRGPGKRDLSVTKNIEPRPSEYAYTLYWAGCVQHWDPEQRQKVASSLKAVVSSPGFRPNEFYRVYSVPGLDDSAHAGASLIALASILAAFDQSELRGDSDE